MPEQAISKQHRKVVRELVDKAYERELSEALAELEAKFREWREGRIDCFDLKEAIHKHHNGVSRKLWSKYQEKPEWLFPILVAQDAIHESEVPPELLSQFQKQIDTLRELE